MKLNVTLSVLFLTATALAIPLQFTHQGLLNDASNAPLNGTYDLVFKLYDGPAPIDSLLWTESHPAVPVTNGLYAVNLGTTTPLASGILERPELWLGVTVNADPEMTPRIRVMSTPYAICAGKADTVTVDNLKDLIQLWAITPDADGDGHNKFTSGGDDCDDWNPAVFSGAPEICDGVDNNCNHVIDEGFTTEYYHDSDGDGFGDPLTLIYSCNPPFDYVTDHTDCNDSSSTTYPGAIELCDELDNDCDNLIDEGFVTIWYLDFDGDGAGDPNQYVNSCEQPAGYVGFPGDCNDLNPDVAPGFTEVCDGIDNNCDFYTDPPGTPGCTPYYFDTDGDGWGSMYFGCMCEDTEYITPLPGDCNDSNFDVNPDASEICGDGIDNDCDGAIDAGDSDCQ